MPDRWKHKGCSSFVSHRQNDLPSFYNQYAKQRVNQIIDDRQLGFLCAHHTGSILPRVNITPI